MSSPEIASVTKPSLVRDWFDALRYWLRGRRGLAVLIASAVVIGGALNWGWLVAVGIAPLLLAFAPCAAMCALGLCASRMGAGSCSSTETTAGDGGAQTAGPEALPTEAVPDANQLALGLDDSSTAARPALVAPAAPEHATETETPEKEKIHA